MNDDQLLRYSRHILLPEIDVEGQERLLAASVAIIGLGGLGSPVALYLAAAGVGRIILVDHDVVELSNLQRQVVHTTNRIGRSKVESAAAQMRAINPDVHIERIQEKLGLKALTTLAADVDVVVDATDNFNVRFDINRACHQSNTPLVSGAAIRFEGQVAVFDPRDECSPCYQCLYDAGDDNALNCSENGVAAPVVGIIGTCQAMETIKLLTGVGQTLAGHVLYFDAKPMEWRKFRLPRRKGCPTCQG